MKKTLTMDGTIALKIYPTATSELKALLEDSFGKEYFDNRGVWILTANNQAVKASDWKTYLSTLDDPADSLKTPGNPVGIGVITKKTAFVVSLHACAALQWGAMGFEDYPEICKDTESYDNEATTSAVIERHRGIECKYSDSGKFDFTGAPAAEWCRSLGPTWSLPTLATTKVIAEHIKAINEALKACGGFTIPNCWLWTSTVKTEDYAYLVTMSNGYVLDNDKNNDCSVRAVSAFHFENFEFLTF